MDAMVQSSSRVGQLERCIIGKEELLLPDNFIEQSFIFNEVINFETWEKVLTPTQRSHLMKFLPTFPVDDQEQKQVTVKRLLSGENFKFGNPVKKFHMKLKGGTFTSEILKYPHLYRKFKFRDYKMRQQRYYTKLFKDVILSRQHVFEMVSRLPPDELPKFCYMPPPPADQSIEHVVNKRYCRILKEVQEECNAEDSSSEEEVEETASQKSRKHLFHSVYPPSSPEPPASTVVATYASRTVANGEIVEDSNDHRKTVRRPLSPVEFSDEDYKAMLRDYKRRKTENGEQPELDIRSITLADILARCQAVKKPAPKSPSAVSDETATSPAVMKKVKKKGEKLKKLKANRVENIVKKATDANPEDVSGIEIPELLSREEECVPEFPLQETLPPKLPFGQYESFFSLLRDLICEFPDAKVTTAKLDDKVKEWQESPTSSLNQWITQQTNWVDNVVSALKFLSGDVYGFQLENFIPLIDYKERAQQWRWIGSGRDADDELGQLCKFWLQKKDDGRLSENPDNTPGTTPPPRVKTNYVVKPTTEEEKLSFKEQERKRFECPHLGFTYHMHGYDSVVGPVKGVYSKDNTMNKAREHALLVSDRPSYVTILTLVRDAAARLPNGEGTRGDICELLKDSQFLAPAITDAQINTVVSGALDRLHYEKDPCVKYDVNRKLWIYLHRCRTEQEFEKIHQAQGAAVKAKKSLQKPKSSKSKSKEMVSASTTTITTVPTSTLQNSKTSPSVTITSTDPIIKTEDPVIATTLPSLVVSRPPKPIPNARVVTSGARTLQGSPKPGLGAAKSATINLSLAQAPSLGNSSSVTGIGNSGTLTTIPISEITKAQTSVSGTHVQGTISASASASTLSKPLTFAIVPSQAAGTSGSPAIASQVRPTTATAKPVSLNLLPGQIVTKSGGAVSGSSLHQATVVITSKPELLPYQQHGVTSAMCVNSSKSLMTGQTILSTANRTAVSTATTATPMVARLVSGPQMVSVGNLLTGAAQKSSSGSTGPTTIKIQGSNILQPMSGGKPVQLTGKAVQAAKGILQIDGKSRPSVNVIQTAQGALPTINIIPQGGNTSVVTLTDSAQMTRPTSSTVTANSGTTTVLSSALQSATVMSQLKTVAVTTSANTLLGQQPLQVVSQPKVVSPGQGGIVVTHLSPGNITLRPGLSGVSQAKVVTATQAGLLPAQFILHQPATGASVKVGSSDTTVTPTVSQATPIIVSSNSGKPTQNIQVVRTVLSQPSSVKAGQTTILISQPALQQSGTPVLSSAQLLQTAKVQGKFAGKGKPPPVYARIITPSAGMKLATVAPGQALPTQGVSVIQAAAAASKISPSAITAPSPQPIKSLERSLSGGGGSSSSGSGGGGGGGGGGGVGVVVSSANISSNSTVVIGSSGGGGSSSSNNNNNNNNNSGDTK
ncbi:nuclear factor related to kappa-B-binding protein-like [Argonauta hians]